MKIKEFIRKLEGLGTPDRHLHLGSYAAIYVTITELHPERIEVPGHNPNWRVSVGNTVLMDVPSESSWERYPEWREVVFYDPYNSDNSCVVSGVRYRLAD